MSELNNRRQNLATRSSEPKVHYTWVEPELTNEKLDVHAKEVRR